MSENHVPELHSPLDLESELQPPEHPIGQVHSPTNCPSESALRRQNHGLQDLMQKQGRVHSYNLRNQAV